MKELVEDNAFDEYAAQLIAHNIFEALKEKMLSSIFQTDLLSAMKVILNYLLTV